MTERDPRLLWVTRLAAPAVLALALLTAGDVRTDPPRALAAEATLLAAGDIASCASSGDEATADLLDTLTGDVAVLGDNAYESGTVAEFTNCYDPSWGRHKARTRPSAGNHEYNTAGATGYYGYFGAAAGDPSKGYYSYDLGDWHVIVINSNCSVIGGCGAGSPQEQWLRADLAANPAACTLAYWHHPRFSSGQHGDNASMQPIWQILYDYRAEVVLGGHDHNYERFAPQTPTGAADPSFGIREFVVGTGGKNHRAFGSIKPNSEVRDNTSYGVLKLSLHATSYDWEFVPVAGASFTDTGSGTCNAGNAYDSDYDGVAETGDNCPGIANPTQLNSDAFVDLGPSKPFDDLTWPNSDAQGDACDADDDNDTLSDATEGGGPPCASASAPTGAANRDSDGDRALDGVECAMGFDPANAASKPPMATCQTTGDADADRVPDSRELCHFGTSNASANTDGDALPDGCEVASVNADQLVNVIDLQQVALSVPPSGGAGYVIGIDVTRDGYINVIDLQFVAGQSGLCP